MLSKRWRYDESALQHTTVSSLQWAPLKWKTYWDNLQRTQTKKPEEIGGDFEKYINGQKCYERDFDEDKCNDTGDSKPIIETA